MCDFVIQLFSPFLAVPTAELILIKHFLFHFCLTVASTSFKGSASVKKEITSNDANKVETIIASQPQSSSIVSAGQAVVMPSTTSSLPDDQSVNMQTVIPFEIPITHVQEQENVQRYAFSVNVHEF